ncbi:hypothetical protein HYDPIDRAFT_118357 [Hydnomerulius pinastri MD-312]|uniref:Uncharacterized protein n=1 Tax=Hydnomerulius pinastri MD-312 TaxID=994086 RepID=A0A0C9V2V5_9AGAM|nr:hypothetical protein HYDPIDRAFT_118357 [Hydnomerulius pinastri MD-312]
MRPTNPHQNTQQDPSIYYIDSDASKVEGILFSIDSGSTFAYVSVLDPASHQDLTDDEAHNFGPRYIVSK